MNDLLQASQWTLAEAIVRVCFGVLEPSTDPNVQEAVGSVDAALDEPDEWLWCFRDGSDIQRAQSLKSAVLEYKFPDLLDVRLYPVVWIWLVSSGAKSSCHPKFLDGFERWLTDIGMKGHCPIIQRRPTDQADWEPLSPDFDRPDFKSGRSLFAALLRKFDAEVALGEWRLVLMSGATSTSKKPASKRGKRSPDSPVCEAMVRAAVAAYAAQTNSPVKVLRKQKKTGQMYRCPELSRKELIAKILKTAEGRIFSDEYESSTYVRAFSAVVQCRRGRPNVSIDDMLDEA